MTLIKSISGIRGTIGGSVGEGLSPLDVVKYTAAYAQWVKDQNPGQRITIVVGRDARISGPMVQSLVVATLSGIGCKVIDLGLATTPTTEIAVKEEQAQGGIILTASHNPKEWNALKLLNGDGEFLSAADGALVLAIAEKESYRFAGVDDLGEVLAKDYTGIHIQQVVDLDLVDVDAIRKANLTVAIDCVNSVGGLVLPLLLEALGVKKVEKLYCEPNGQFPHNPEPLPEHLTEISALIKRVKADVGFVVDPDVDRLAIVCENGEMFGEEYTLVSIADYILSQTPGNTVSNLSSTRALREVTRRYGMSYQASAVGEVNVVEKMKATNAVIGGEGNGGIIYPPSHYGRDALVGIALFLTQLARSGQKVSELRSGYPSYFMAKQKVELTPGVDVDAILEQVRKQYSSFEVNSIDGVKIDFPDKWAHLRKSNTEPIIRIYTEAPSMEEAGELASEIRAVIQQYTCF